MLVVQEVVGMAFNGEPQELERLWELLAAGPVEKDPVHSGGGWDDYTLEVQRLLNL